MGVASKGVPHGCGSQHLVCMARPNSSCCSNNQTTTLGRSNKRQKNVGQTSIIVRGEPSLWKVLRGKPRKTELWVSNQNSQGRQSCPSWASCQRNVGLSPKGPGLEYEQLVSSCRRIPLCKQNVHLIPRLGVLIT